MKFLALFAAVVLAEDEAAEGAAAEKLEANAACTKRGECAEGLECGKATQKVAEGETPEEKTVCNTADSKAWEDPESEDDTIEWSWAPLPEGAKSLVATA